MKPSLKPVKPRAILNQEQAIQIFKSKDDLPSAELATIFHVSEKAVRDIWTGRTWSRETWHLDTSRTLQIKQPGRPKGSKDSQPRKRRARDSVAHLDESSSFSIAAGLGGPAPLKVYAESLDRYQHGSDADHLSKQRCNHSQSAYEQLLADDYIEADTDGSSTWCRSDPSSAYNTERKPPSMRHRGSIDEQLHAWGAFWSRTRSADPFRGDWTPKPSEY